METTFVIFALLRGSLMVLRLVAGTDIFVRAARLVQDLDLRVEIGHLVVVVHADLDRPLLILLLLPVV